MEWFILGEDSTRLGDKHYIGNFPILNSERLFFLNVINYKSIKLSELVWIGEISKFEIYISMNLRLLTKITIGTNGVDSTVLDSHSNINPAAVVTHIWEYNMQILQQYANSVAAICKLFSEHFHIHTQLSLHNCRCLILWLYWRKSLRPLLKFFHIYYLFYAYFILEITAVNP